MSSESKAPARYIDSIHATSTVILSQKGDYHIDPHWHPYFELLYILRGTRCVCMQGRTWQANGGDLIVFRPGEVHEEYAGSKSISFFGFQFPQEKLVQANLSFPETAQLGPVIKLPHKDRFLEVFTRMAEEHKRGGADSELMLGAHLVEFIVLLGRAVARAHEEQSGARGDSTARVRMAMEYIQANTGGDVNLQDLARRSFMSVSHFAQLFKETAGESPKRYLIRQRIERAKELLVKSDKSAQDIALLLGYDSPYYFYRQFKEHTGMTALQFRHKTRNG